MENTTKDKMNQSENEMDEDETSCPTSRRTHFYKFKELDIVLNLIESLPLNVRELRTKEKAYEKFLFICDTYQEQPHLIDPYLSQIFDKLIEQVKQSNRQLNAKERSDELNDSTQFHNDLINEAFAYMHCLVKMRGYKKIVQYMPHEVVDLEPVISLLERQDKSDAHKWQTRYMLLLWLSILCMVPFDLSRFDASEAGDHDSSVNGERKIMMHRLLDVCMPYMSVADKCQEASVYMLAKYMSRVDLKSTVLPDFFQRLFVHIDEAQRTNNSIKLLGALRCLASIYKYGKREELLKYTLPTLECLLDRNLLNTSVNNLVRKFHVKLVQRVGMTFFKYKIAKWRYERGSRLLVNNLRSTMTEATQTAAIKEAAPKGNEISPPAVVDGYDEDEKIPHEIEEIIEQLLIGLRDRDTIVRWSSAKGIGRITNRLAAEMADDILASVLDLFAFVEDDAAWHGGCLCIAELGRRGLLLPHKLPACVPIVLKALVFDKKLGNYSLGRNVRDSACYVCWSLARAFEPAALAPFVNDIAGALLVVAVFDREVNVRRAASAAFQENVGRQGQFAHGIDILTKCDYYAVGQLPNCYLTLSAYIAQYKEYRQALVDHLLEHKYNHWDQVIRELAAQSLFNLTAHCPDYMAFVVLPALLKHAHSVDLNTRHGALISLAEIMHALCDWCASFTASEVKSTDSLQHSLLARYFSPSIVGQLVHMIDKLFDEKYLRGAGGEYIRPAVCFFLRKMNVCKLFHKRVVLSSENAKNIDDGDQVRLNGLSEKFLSECESFLIQSIEHIKENVQTAAAEAIGSYCDLKYMLMREETSRHLVLDEILVCSSKLVDEFVASLRATSKEHVMCGYCLALANMPKYLLRVNNNFVKIVDTLIEASAVKQGPLTKDSQQPQLLLLSQSTQSLQPPFKLENNEAGWVQARRDAIKSLKIVLKEVKSIDDFRALDLSEKVLMKMFDCFLTGLNDYSIDSKGDSGSKVREVSIEALESLLTLCAKHGLSRITGDERLVAKVFAGVAQQAVERIDRTRSIAGRTFANLLTSKHLKLDSFDFVNKIRKVFDKIFCDSADWNVAHVTFPLFAKLIVVDELRVSLLYGFIYSIGSLTESLVKPATSSFIKELHNLNAGSSNARLEYAKILANILSICSSHLKNDRMGVSLIKSVDLLIQNGLLNESLVGESGESKNVRNEFLNIFLENVKLSKDMSKLIAYVDLFCDMLQFDDERIRQRAMTQLMIMLLHQYPKVRKATASRLFESLINYADEMFDSEQDYEECVNLLTETNWDQPIDSLRPIRNKICDLTKTPMPVMKTSAKQ
jgi:tubulin-specific chaperone D